MNDSLAKLSAALVDARHSGALLRAADWPDALPEADDAYLVQEEVGRRMGWFGPDAPHYWKSGGASQIDPLLHCRLPAVGVRPDGADLSDLRLRSPYVEAEIALRLRADVTPERARALVHGDAEGLVDAMALAIEIADSRWAEQWNADPSLRLADTASHGALVLGEWMPFAGRAWGQQAVRADCGRGEPVLFKAAYTLKDPAWLLPIWLRHATRHGATVPAGAVVTTGSWIGAQACDPGSRVSAEFLGLGRISARL